MATLQEVYQVWTQATETPATPLLQRTVAAVALAARDVLAELPATPNHDARLRWAQQVLHDPEGMTRRLFIGVAVQAAGLSDISAVSDAQIQAAVASIINAFANTV